MNLLALSDFEPLVNTTFGLEITGEPRIELVLISATRIPIAGRPMSDDGRPFSLLFRGPVGRPLDQGTHELDHPETGPLGIFLVPMQPDSEGPIYEAVFA